jgi:hypothetical protein
MQWVETCTNTFSPALFQKCQLAASAPVPYKYLQMRASAGQRFQSASGLILPSALSRVAIAISRSQWPMRLGSYMRALLLLWSTLRQASED